MFIYYFLVSILCIFHIYSTTYCSIFMYCYHVLFMYCVHILFFWYTFHITFSCMHCTCSYTLRVLSYTFLYNRVSSYFVLYYLTDPLLSDTIHYILCTMHYVLFTMYYALCTMHYTLFTMYYALYTMHYALCTIHTYLYVFIRIYYFIRIYAYSYVFTISCGNPTKSRDFGTHA